MFSHFNRIVYRFTEDMHLITIAFQYNLSRRLIENCPGHKHCEQDIDLLQIRIERLLHLADNLDGIIQTCRIQKMCLRRNNNTI